VESVIREYDYAFRIGGDEFLLLLPETNREQASLLAERIRKQIEDQKVVDKNNLILSLTASFGIAQYNQNDASIETVTRKADEALYQAKKSGRNRVVVLDRFAKV
jgi:diguanylate cyclase (GGDEF)-like protein